MSDGLFDWSLYGALIKHKRIQRGIKNVPAFSDFIRFCTRESISRDALYRIEQGRQTPSAEQFIAINLALFGAQWPSSDASFLGCFSEGWREYVEEERMPHSWLLEELTALFEVYGFTNDDGDKCFFDCDLPEPARTQVEEGMKYLARAKPFTYEGEEYKAYGAVGEFLIC